MKPTIEISCWHCKHYDGYYCRCRKTRKEISWEESHISFCFLWAPLKKSVSSALCDYCKSKKDEIVEQNGFFRLKGGAK